MLLRGIGASAGRCKGTVKIVLNTEEMEKVCEGDVLVSVMTDPRFVPAMIRAGAIVTNTGGMLSHAAIISRELGKPCVVGTIYATVKLKDGMKVVVDGSNGVVYEDP